MTEPKIEFDENINDYVITDQGRVLETSTVNKALSVYVDPDICQQSFGLDPSYNRSLDIYKGFGLRNGMITFFTDYLSEDGTLKKNGFVEWKHKDLSQYLS